MLPDLCFHPPSPSQLIPDSVIVVDEGVKLDFSLAREVHSSVKGAPREIRFAALQGFSADVDLARALRPLSSLRETSSHVGKLATWVYHNSSHIS